MIMWPVELTGRYSVTPSTVPVTMARESPWRVAIANANTNLPTGTLYGANQVYAVQSTGQLFTADAYRPIIVAYRNGSPIRLGEVARVIDGVLLAVRGNITRSTMGASSLG